MAPARLLGSSGPLTTQPYPSLSSYKGVSPYGRPNITKGPRAPPVWRAWGTQLSWQGCLVWAGRGAQSPCHMRLGRAQLTAEAELLLLQYVCSAEPRWDLAEEGTSLSTISSSVKPFKGAHELQVPPLDFESNVHSVGKLCAAGACGRQSLGTRRPCLLSDPCSG